MLAEKLRRKRGQRKALNPSSFLFILCGQAYGARGGVMVGRWREGCISMVKQRRQKRAMGAHCFYPISTHLLLISFLTGCLLICFSLAERG